jgi:hypothetical protein
MHTAVLILAVLGLLSLQAVAEVRTARAFVAGFPHHSCFDS